MVGLCMSAGAITPTVWTVSPAVYTNLFGRELVNETWLRDRWTGDTNWWLTNSVQVTYDFSNQVFTRTFTNGTDIISRIYTNVLPLTTNIVVTNCLGDRFIVLVNGHSITGNIPFHSEGSEVTTRRLEALLPLFTLPHYRTGETFDAWFANILSTNEDGTTNFMDRFPLGESPKADLFQKAGIGVTTYLATNEVSTNVVVGWTTNQYGEVTNCSAWFTKRKDRPDPLIVAEWGLRRSILVNEGLQLPFTNGCEYYCGWPNEFTRGDTALFGLSTNQYPVFVVHPAGSNEYVSGLSLRLFDDLYWDGGLPGPSYWLYPWPWPDWIINEYYARQHSYEWTTNNIIHDVGYGADWQGGTITLNSATQRSDRAWLSLGAPLKLVGVPPNGSNVTVSLQYTNRMNTYEGNKVWDAVLLPEQLLEHFIVLTNAFLTEIKWDSGKLWWTNGVGYSNSIPVPPWYTNYICTNVPDLMPTTNSSEIVTVDTMGYRQTSPSNGWFRGVGGVWLPETLNLPGQWFPFQYTNGMAGVAPRYDYTVAANVWLEEDFRMECSFWPPYDYLYPSPPFRNDAYGIWAGYPPYWSGHAWRNDTVTFALSGASCVSSLAVSGMYTGTPHKVHVYAKFNYDRVVSNTPPIFHLIESIGWTNAEQVITSPIDVATNYTGIDLPLSFVVWPKQNGPLPGGLTWEEYDMPDVCLPASSNVWVADPALSYTNTPLTNSQDFLCELLLTNGFTVDTSTNLTAYTNIVATDAGDADADALGIYTGQYLVHMNNGVFEIRNYWVGHDEFRVYSPGYSWYYVFSNLPPVDATSTSHGTLHLEKDQGFTTNYLYTTNWNVSIITNDFRTNGVIAVVTQGMYYTNLPYENCFHMKGWAGYIPDNSKTPPEKILVALYTNYNTAVSNWTTDFFLPIPASTSYWDSGTTATNCNWGFFDPSHGECRIDQTNSSYFSCSVTYPVDAPIPEPWTKCADGYWNGASLGWNRHYFYNGFRANLYDGSSVITTNAVCDVGPNLNQWDNIWWTTAPDGLERRVYGDAVPAPLGTLLYYETGPWVFERTTYVLPLPCDYWSNTVGWVSAEATRQSGSTNVVRVNSVNVKVLVEWQR